MSLRVVLVDDHQLIRRGLRSSLTDDFHMDVVGEAGSISEAESVMAQAVPDVAVVDVHLPDGNGIDLVRSQRQARAELGLVVLTMSIDDNHLLAALDAGASAFVRKDASTEEVAAAVQHANASPTRFRANGLDLALLGRAESGRARLTPREQQILRLLSEGLATGAIGRRLYISESTVKTHVATLYEKLDAHNRAQALMTALQQGLIEQPPGQGAPQTTGAAPGRP